MVKARPHPRAATALAFGLMGAFSLAAQTALFREYLVVYEGNELGAGFFFSSWLLWVGAGAALSLLVLRRAPAGRRSFSALLAAYPAAFLLQLLLIRSLRDIGGVAATDLFPASSLFLLTYLTNAPVSLVTGALFPLGAAASKEEGTDAGASVSRVYVFECLGAFAGGAGITLFLLSGRGALPAMVLLSAALGGAGLLLARRVGHRPGALLNLVVLAGSLVLLLPSVGGAVQHALDRRQAEELFPRARLLARKETPYRRLDVVAFGRQTVAVANGRILSAWPAGDAGLADAALLASQTKAPGKVLLVGSGLEPLLLELLRYPVERVVLLEPDEPGHRFLLAHMPEAVRSALDDERVEVLYGDPLEQLARAGPGGAGFDLVVTDVGDPDTALAARFFTVEAYELFRSRLAAGGVFATAITSAENYYGTEVTRYGASVLATLEQVFSKVAVTPGERAWFIAGGEASLVSLDAGVLEERLRRFPIRDRRFEPERIHVLLEPERVEDARATYTSLPREERRGLVSTTDRPQVYLLNLLVLGKREEAGLARLVHALRGAGIGVFLLPFLAVLLVRARYVLGRPEARRSRRFAGGYLLVVVGAASLALALVLLLTYQLRFGLLFKKVGLANAFFMLGLFAGGLLGARLARRWPGSEGVLAGAAGTAAALFALLLPALTGQVAGEAAFLALFAVAGLLLGAPFSLAASLLGRAGSGATVAGGILECADHLGGALGAAVAGLLLVPLFGTAAAARLLGVVLLTAPALLVLEAAVSRVRASGPLGIRIRRMRSRLTTYPYVRAGFVLFGLVLAAAAFTWPVRRELDRPLTRLDERRLRETVPEAGWFAEREEPYLHYEARVEGREEALNVTLATMAIPVAVSGYGGPINLLLSIDHDGTIRRVSLLDHEEDVSYIQELPAFLSRLEGRSAAGDFRLVGKGEARTDHDLVSVTGATVSCRASVETVNRAKNRVLEDLLGRAPPDPAGDEGPSPWGPAEVATLVLFLLAVPTFLRCGSRVRTLFLVVVLVVLGVLHNQQLAARGVVELLTLSLPPVGNLAHFLLVTGALGLAVAFGQVYCGLLCPFGAAQELAGKLGLRVRVSPELDRRARFTKHGVLAAAATGALLLGADAVLGFDPLGIAFSFKAGPVMWVLIGLVLFLSLFYFRFWCRYLCPVGAFLSLFNRVALLRRFARPKDYRRCDLGVRSKLDLDCLHCNRCIGKMGYGPISPFSRGSRP